MNILQSNLTYTAGQLFFKGVPVAGFRSLKVAGADVRITVFKDQATPEQIADMRAGGIKVWSKT